MWPAPSRARAAEAAVRRVQVALKAAEAAPSRVPVALKRMNRRRTSPNLRSRRKSLPRSPVEVAEAGPRNSAGCTKRQIGLREERKMTLPAPG